MPIHDWTRVTAGTFHHLHAAWIPEISSVLNNGVLPPEYYALSDQVAGELGPDVITLQAPDLGDDGGEVSGGTTVALAPPQVGLTARTEIDQYAARRRRVVIHHTSDDRIIAIIEIVSPGNKSGRQALQTFVSKAVHALARGLHLLLIDLFPPSRRDPQGIHGVLWEQISDDVYAAPADRPLTLASYSGGSVVTAYVEPTAVGAILTDMPLFLTPERYVSVPLESTYQAAYRGMPQRWRRVLEG